MPINSALSALAGALSGLADWAPTWERSRQASEEQRRRQAEDQATEQYRRQQNLIAQQNADRLATQGEAAASRAEEAAKATRNQQAFQQALDIRKLVNESPANIDVGGEPAGLMNKFGTDVGLQQKMHLGQMGAPKAIPGLEGVSSPSVEMPKSPITVSRTQTTAESNDVLKAAVMAKAARGEPLTDDDHTILNSSWQPKGSGGVNYAQAPGMQGPGGVALRFNPDKGVYEDPVTGQPVAASQRPSQGLHPVMGEDGKVTWEFQGGAAHQPTGTQPFNLTGAQTAELSDLDTLGALSDQVLTKGKAVKWHGVGGMGQGTVADLLYTQMGVGDPKEADLRSTISNIYGTIAKLRGGTALTESEKTLLNKYVPTINESPESIQTKANGLKNFVATKRGATIGAAQTRLGRPLSGSSPVPTPGGIPLSPMAPMSGHGSGPMPNLFDPNLNIQVVKKGGSN